MGELTADDFLKLRAGYVECKNLAAIICKEREMDEGYAFPTELIIDIRVDFLRAELKAKYSMRCKIEALEQILTAKRSFLPNGNLIPLKLMKYDHADQMTLLSKSDHKTVATFTSDRRNKALHTLLVEHCDIYDIESIRMYDLQDDSIHVYQLVENIAIEIEDSFVSYHTVRTGVTAALVNENQEEQQHDDMTLFTIEDSERNGREEDQASHMDVETYEEQH